MKDNLSMVSVVVKGCIILEMEGHGKESGRTICRMAKDFIKT
jgi:hypothetical protein